ncbi:MAG: DUF177 domain-containing protein [Patescibacteria group bacterium]|jgi:uncharacterized protein
MKIEVKNLLNQPEGSTENYPLEITALPIDEAKAQITGQAVLTHLDEFILAQIKGDAHIIQPCSRCLKEVILTIPLNFSREFKTEIPSPAQNNENIDEEAYPIEDGQMDLDPVLTEEIIASIPLRVLCQKDCQGLCPKCGANLNDNPCKCDKVKFEIHNKINL